MCKIIDDVLPIVGAVAGFALGGPVGAAAGGALGGGIGNYAQTHSLTGAGLGALTGGVGGYFGGGSLAGALGNLGGAGVGAASAGFDTSLASATPAMEGLTAPAGFDAANLGAGGAASGIGTGIGQGTSLSGITATPAGMALGGASGPLTGLTGALGGQTAAPTAPEGGATSLNDVMNGGAGGFGQGLTAGGGQGLQASPTSTLGSLNTPTSSGVLTPGASLAEGGQATAPGAVPGQVSTGAGGMSLEGGQGAAMPGGAQQAAFAGPGTSATNANDFGMSGPVTGGSIGDYSTSGPVGAGGIGSSAGMNPSDLMQLFQQTQANPWMKLGQTGLNFIQQLGQQNAQRGYANQVSGLFGPNSPYAQQMQETLARQDAAAGRNSQYGTRATQLAAALAEAQSRALSNPSYAAARTATPGLSALNSLFANFGTNQGMQQLGQMGTSAFNGLRSLFS